MAESSLHEVDRVDIEYFRDVKSLLRCLMVFPPDEQDKNSAIWHTTNDRDELIYLLLNNFTRTEKRQGLLGWLGVERTINDTRLFMITHRQYAGVEDSAETLTVRYYSVEHVFGTNPVLAVGHDVEIVADMLDRARLPDDERARLIRPHQENLLHEMQDGICTPSDQERQDLLADLNILLTAKERAQHE